MVNEQSSALSLMEKLKESTRSMHNSAESSKFQSWLAHGKLSESVYADYLEQLYLVHSLLEGEIKNSGQESAAILTDNQLQEPFLRNDLEHFGRHQLGDSIALESTKKLLESIRKLSESCPVALLGMHYVLLGSKHGGKFIAKSCQDSYKLTDGIGAKYFDPYGQNFMPLWKNFKESMNRLELTEIQEEELCQAAGDMFLAIAEIGDEMMKSKIQPVS